MKRQRLPPVALYPWQSFGKDWPRVRDARRAIVLGASDATTWSAALAGAPFQLTPGLLEAARQIWRTQ